MDQLALPGTAVDGLLSAAAVAVVGALGAVALRRFPRWALGVWLAVLCLVPVWVVVDVVVEWEPQVLATAVVVACLVTARPRGGPRIAFRLTLADGVVALLVLTALVPLSTGATSFSVLFVLLLKWTAPYVLGRVVASRVHLPWVYAAVATAATLAAVFALVEAVTGWNPFVQIPGSGRLYEDWSPIQVRGGEERVEGAFGHSIALGCCLALATPLALAAPFRTRTRVPMVVLLVVAAAVTFSRVGLLTAVLGVVLTVVFLRTGLPPRLRAVVTLGLVGVGAGLFSLLSGVFAAAGAEATDSADYRWALLDLVPDMVPFGRSPSMYFLPTGQSYFGTVSSVDNALLLLGLTYGWVPLAVILVLPLAGCWYLVRGRATAPTIAVVAQIPALVSVALITQYATFFWFLVGLAVASQSMGSTTRKEPDAGDLPLADVAEPLLENDARASLEEVGQASGRHFSTYRR